MVLSGGAADLYTEILTPVQYIGPLDNDRPPPDGAK